MTSLNRILEHPPEVLINCVQKMSCEKLQIELSKLNAPINATEYPLNLLEAYLKDIFVNWKLDGPERNNLLAALARNSATQIINIPLFLKLWKAIEQKIPPEISTFEEDLNNTLKTLRIHYVPIHFVYALIHDRLRTRFHPNCYSIGLEELQKLMTSTDIRLSPSSSQLFQQSLVESTILNTLENRINIPLLLSVSQSLRHIYEEECLQSTLYDQQVLKRAESARVVSSTSLRTIQAIQPQWGRIRKHILSQSQSQDLNISLTQFSHAVQRVGGLLISPKDLQEIWKYIALKGNIDWVFEDEQELLFPLPLIDQVMKDPEANFSSLSALMRDDYSKPQGLKVFLGSPNKEDHITSLLVSSDQIPLPNSYHRTNVSPFPWHRNEAGAMSNVRRRVVEGLRRSGPEKKNLFAQSLVRAERLRLNSSDLGIPRADLFEALACAGIHLARNDAQDLWNEMITTFTPQTPVAEILIWLDVDLPRTDSLPSPQTADSLLVGGRTKSSSLASYHHRQQQQHDRHQQLSSHSSEWQLDPHSSALFEFAQIILKNKAHLAFVFRSSGCGSGIISGTDLCHALRQHPYNITLDDNSLWKFICQIVSMDPSVAPRAVFLRYNEVISYLELELKRLSPSQTSTLQSSLRQKLEQSRYIQGKSDRILGHLQILRQRLKNIQQRGSSTSWEGVPDMCSHREFVSLLQSIDLNFSLEEVDFIWRESRKNRSEENSWNFITGGSCGDEGVKAISIGSGLSYLESLLSSN